MIITFATQKGGTGKTTLAIAFSNFLSKFKKKNIKVYDLDYQKSFHYKWTEDETLEVPKLYDVEIIEEALNFFDFEKILEMKEDDTIYIFDLAGTLDHSYSEILMYSDFIIIPFEYSDVSVKSTMVFINYLGLSESEAEKIFVRSKMDKGYNYLNQKEMDVELSRFGTLIEAPIYKRNCLQTINTRSLTYEQRSAVNKTFEEIIYQINNLNKINSINGKAL